MSDFIPEEIVAGVLKRLPPESLMRSRCVCKWWKQLIDSPSFILDHLAFQKSRFLVLNVFYEEVYFHLLDPQTLPLVVTLPYSFEKRDLALVGTLHGIICFYKCFNMTSGIYLWNPSMRKLLNVPLPEYMHYYRYTWDPEDAGNYPGTCSAFWIDPLTKHFKMVVVKMVYDYGEFVKYGAVYSSIEGDWKEISLGQLKSIADLRFCCIESGGLVMRKVAYWSAYYFTPKGCKAVYCKYRAVVISFDFERERFDSIEGPSGASETRPSVCNWKGSLSLVYLDVSLDEKKRCDFYSRQEGSWVNLFSIILTPNIREIYCLLKEVGENSKILLAETTTDELVLYDSTRGGCVTLKSADDKPYFDSYVAHGFVESLVFP